MKHQACSFVKMAGLAALFFPTLALGAPQVPPSAPVTVVNTSANPVPVTGSISGTVNANVTGDVNAAIVGTPQVKIATDQVPFAKQLCLPNFCTQASQSSFTVPDATAGGQAVKELVINFVSGRCTGTGRMGAVELIATKGAAVIADTGDNFSTNYFPAAVDQYDSALGQNGLQAFAQHSQITYAPGTSIQMTFSVMQAGEIFCKVQLNDHFVTQ